MPECRELVKAATLLAVANNRFVLEPIDMAKVQFRHAIEAFDTFIPGREEADEHTVIYAKIPLRWKSERTEPKDGNAQ